MEKINLLYVVTGLGIGGAERVVFDLSTHTNQNIFNINVVSLSKRVEMLNIFREQGVETTALCKGNDIKSLIKMIKFLNSFVRENNINIIHAHMTHAVIVSSMVKLCNPKIKIVFTSHSINIESTIREFLLFLLKPLRSIDILFSKEQLKYFYKKRYKCIPNGISIQDYELEVKKENKFIFLAVGRVDHEKNHRLLIDIAKKISSQYEFEIWIAGDGLLRTELEQLVKEYKVETRVKFLGLRKDIPILLNQVSCFVMTSLWEGFPISLLEAGAAKLPVISTPVGSIPSLLNNKNAYLARNEEFYEKMIEVMDNYEEALKKAEKLKEEIVANYSLRSIVKQHEDIYTKLVSK